MICAHIVTLPVPAGICGEAWQALNLSDGKHALLVHSDCHACNDPSTRMHHPLSTKTVSAGNAALLAEFGVTATDTVASALLKIGETWGAAYP